ncbi:beta-1,4-N-acetylgalactosaminyltransferase 3 isoform X1 [Lepisosteus oculatus]|uniref:beta-1,4-N-acetylgalactosaminyltransferase 3 isoform X1 n=1 Tax=Lepisosteus oculatus TaxID=7918 RepID=UPI0037161505
MMFFFPVKKLRRNVKYVVFVAVLMFGALTAYLQFVASNTWSPTPHYSPWNDLSTKERSDSEREYKGQANLHIFEDWCGSSVDQLRKNLHYPLFAHTRTTVKKLAVSPRWTNYGLRIFGYLHPYIDGEYQFAVASDDNSEFWLSSDDQPLNLSLLAFVGKTGKEWTAPGEYEKYTSQISRPVQLKTMKKYYFEVIHKQNDHGTDHVEVAWRLSNSGLKFTVINSNYISLYKNESSLKMSEVSHVPQSTASHVRSYSEMQQTTSHGAEMLREDPRDTFFQVPMIDSSYLRRVLPDCTYKPTYNIKGFPLLRYQGLQFVHMSYVYPNDYTRLTHMETENKCFYHENPYYLEKFGFFKYMKMDALEKRGFGEGHLAYWKKRERPESISASDGHKSGYTPDGMPVHLRAYTDMHTLTTDFDFEERFKDHMKSEGDDKIFQYEDEQNPEPNPVKQITAKEKPMQDYGDDYDDYNFRRRQKLFSLPPSTKVQVDQQLRRRKRRIENDVQNPVDVVEQKGAGKRKVRVVKTKKIKKLKKTTQSFKAGSKYSESTPVPFQEKKIPRKMELEKVKQKVPIRRSVTNESQPAFHLSPNSRNLVLPKSDYVKKTMIDFHVSKNASLPTSIQDPPRTYNMSRKGNRSSRTEKKILSADLKKTGTTRKKTHLLVLTGEKEGMQEAQVGLETKPRRDEEENQVTGNIQLPYISRVQRRAEDKSPLDVPDDELANNRVWMQPEVDSNMEEDGMKEEFATVDFYDQDVNWDQTFDVNHLDFHALRSDWIDLHCNVSGNLLLRELDALPVVEAYMRKLNERNNGVFSLERVVNVEKHLDGWQGSRYLLELELLESGKRRVRLAQYVYVLNQRGRNRSLRVPAGKEPPLRPGRSHSSEELLLCNPLGFSWRESATVHFIVPVKNQARWVRQFIVDMEELYRVTGDKNFNVIIIDYSSTDMDVEQALRTSALHRYQYVQLTGNFERSAGLQAGINLITDDHSIVFLCDLHIHFPASIIDSVRKHCVEGKMAFAPIVMRLNCGATPQEPDGFWEVNGFGLLGIYKSDLDAAGGMNTLEFRDRWGGEDWELLDRILQAGLEVERIYLRNFLHHYHSKRGMWNRRLFRST